MRLPSRCVTQGGCRVCLRRSKRSYEQQQKANEKLAKEVAILRNRKSAGGSSLLLMGPLGPWSGSAALGPGGVMGLC
jgi:hypothetical protein